MNGPDSGGGGWAVVSLSAHLVHERHLHDIDQGPAASLLEDRGDILMASAKYGKGTVFAVADPWIYNEYTDGQNLPPEYDNLGGAVELVNWLVKQVP